MAGARCIFLRLIISFFGSLRDIFCAKEQDIPPIVENKRGAGES